MEQNKDWLNNFILKYRLAIGIVLIVSILIASAILLWQNKKDEQGNSDLSKLQTQINNLENNQKELFNKYNELVSKFPASPSEPAATAESVKSASVSTNIADTKETTQPASQSQSGLININTAGLKELDSLSGIGPVYAQRIIDYRQANGGFKSIEEIKNIKGIGDKTFEKFKDKITI